MLDDLRFISRTPIPDAGFHDDVVAGLSAHPKTLPCKYFYNAEGSRLFEAICELPEYYPTRTESRLLADIAPQIAARIPAGAALVEFGSGASTKTRLLLDAAPQLGLYVPIDISATALADAAVAIGRDYPRLAVAPLAEDFTHALDLPPAARGRPVIGFFPGSTIGNFAPAEATVLLRGARHLFGDGARFVIGVDLAKPPATVLPAYDDAQGVTAAFNKNLLVRINRELGGDFDLEAFDHKAVWNPAESRIEMHLASRRDQSVRIGDRLVAFRAGETIHTENSYKYPPGAFLRLAEQAGWHPDDAWTSDRDAFGIFMLAADA